MKTKQRILHTSLMLFNLEGEANVTTVDIANELDISPGNLYYHFKGKDVIINELFAMFEESISEVLRAPVAKPLSMDDNWFYLYVVFEEIFKFRFVYRNLTDLLSRDGTWYKRFQRILDAKVQAVAAIVKSLRSGDVISITDPQIDVLAEQAALTITYWLPHDDLRRPRDEEELRMHRGVFQVMALIAPYMGDKQSSFYQRSQEFLRQAGSRG